MLDEGALDLAIGLFRTVSKRFSNVELYRGRHVCVGDGNVVRLGNELTLETLATLPHPQVARDATGYAAPTGPRAALTVDGRCGRSARCIRSAHAPVTGGYSSMDAVPVAGTAGRPVPFKLQLSVAGGDRCARSWLR